MLRLIDAAARRVVAWPLAIAGIVLTEIAGGMLRVAAWLIDVDYNEV